MVLSCRRLTLLGYFTVVGILTLIDKEARVGRSRYEALSDVDFIAEEVDFGKFSRIFADDTDGL